LLHERIETELIDIQNNRVLVRSFFKAPDGASITDRRVKRSKRVRRGARRPLIDATLCLDFEPEAKCNGDRDPARPSRRRRIATSSSVGRGNTGSDRDWGIS
jgi:hypothetical protein